MPKLIERKSREIEKGAPPLSRLQIDEYLREVPGWEVRDNTLTRSYKFENYYQTMSFTVAVAMLAQSENHHPDMEVGYNKLAIRFSTHSVGGLSENDFICAAKVNAILPH